MLTTRPPGELWKTRLQNCTFVTHFRLISYNWTVIIPRIKVVAQKKMLTIIFYTIQQWKNLSKKGQCSAGLQQLISSHFQRSTFSSSYKVKLSRTERLLCSSTFLTMHLPSEIPIRPLGNRWEITRKCLPWMKYVDWLFIWGKGNTSSNRCVQDRCKMY